MVNTNEPATERRVISALANALKLKIDDVFVPVMQARSFLSGSANRMARVEDIATKADMGSGPGIIEGLKFLGGLFLAAEGFSIASNAAAIGSGVVAVLGLTVPAAIAALIGIGVFALGAFLLIKGVQVLWPFIKQRLESELGAEWRSLLDV